MYTVKMVADLAGVSIRTLHYYDQIGLLRPAPVSPSGYRLYADADLARLQQILFYRELGFSLQQIKEILDRPGFDLREALQNHREMLLAQKERLERLIHTVDRTLERMERGMPMEPKDWKELFDGFDPSQYEEEARQRWGKTQAYQESVERARRYTRDDWESIKKESQEIYQHLADLMDRAPDDPEVQHWIGRWHQLIDQRFYTCPPDLFRCLGEMYLQDERFTANIDRIRKGLAAFMKEAMAVYADRLATRS
ncbi:MAG TPA: MerR family transcriptional regulator [Symbiobacteriaceae bacterium]